MGYCATIIVMNRNPEAFDAGDISEVSLGRYTEETQEIDDAFTKKANIGMLDQSRDYYLTETATSNGQTIEINGVMHTPETFLSHRKKITESIMNSSSVFSEATPGIGWDTEKEVIQEIISAINKQKHPEFWAKELSAWVSNEPAILFFREVERISAAYNKSVITADPHSGGRNLMELIKEMFGTTEGSLLSRTDEEIQQKLYALAAAGAGTGILCLVAKLLHIVRTPLDGYAQKKAPSGMTRRAFLQGGLAVLGTALVGGEIHNKAVQEDIATTIEGGGPGANSSFLYNVLDYRNVAVSRGIQEYTKRHQSSSPLTLFYGGLHTNSLKYYIEHPEIVDKKLLLYAPYRNVRAPELTSYRFEREAPNSLQGTWVKIEEIPL